MTQLFSAGDYLKSMHATIAEQAEANRQFLIEMRRDQERLRGVKAMRLKLLPPVPTTLVIDGPAPGWAWCVMGVTCVLTGADSVAIYQGSGTAADAAAQLAPLGYIPPVSSTAPAQAVGSYTWAKGAAVLFNGEGLYLATSGAFRFTQVTVAAIQCPAEEIGKLLT